MPAAGEKAALAAREAHGGGALAKALLARRDRYNALFASARHRYPRLDADEFSAHLLGPLGDIVEAVAEQSPERVPEVADLLYELALDLIGRDLLGPRARSSAVTRGWATLLPSLALHIAAEPRRVVASVTNALHNLEAAGARPDEWMGAMMRLAPVCPDADALLAAGQVAAWRAGMAHFRAAALDLAARLDPRQLAAALYLPEELGPERAPQLIDRLRGDPWHNPDVAAQAPVDVSARVARRAGAFRGFGGHFAAPPTVRLAEGRFVVVDGVGAWVLAADRFGATFHPVDPSALPAPDAVAASRFAMGPGGRVRGTGREWIVPELRTCTSWACDGVTLAVTTAVSHAVVLIACADVGEPL